MNDPKRWRRKFGRWFYGDSKIDWAYVDKSEQHASRRTHPWYACTNLATKTGFRTLREARAWVESKFKPRKRKTDG